MRVYVASPYCPRNAQSLHDAPRIAQHNVDKAIEVANRLIEEGHIPFVPHLTHYIHIHYSCKRDYDEWWYTYDNSFLRYWAEALLYLDSSKGTNKELKLAKKLGLKIYYSVEEILNEQ